MKGEVRRERENLKDLDTARVTNRSPLPTICLARAHNHPTSNPATQEPTPVTMRALQIGIEIVLDGIWLLCERVGLPILRVSLPGTAMRLVISVLGPL